MATCVNCGRALESVGSEGLCENCMSSSGHGIGTPAEVPCQRCGMYLPPHELRMWNSRLYCAYCIMDIMDEEKMGKEKAHEPRPEGVAPAESGAGGLLGGLFGSGKNELQQYPSHSSGACERCGRRADMLYTVGGIRLCQHCYSEGGESPSRPSRMGQIVEKAKSFLKIKSEPRPAPKEEQKFVFDVRSRKMVERKTALPSREKDGESSQGKEEPQGWQEKSKGESHSSGQSSWKAGASSQAQGQPLPPSGVFDTRDRKLIEKKEGMEGQQPIPEGKREEKKPNAAAKKFFFKLHPASPKKK